MCVHEFTFVVCAYLKGERGVQLACVNEHLCGSARMHKHTHTHVYSLRGSLDVLVRAQYCTRPPDTYRTLHPGPCTGAVVAVPIRSAVFHSPVPLVAALQHLLGPSHPSCDTGWASTSVAFLQLVLSGRHRHKSMRARARTHIHTHTLPLT